jgi:hypothetical protein
MSLNLIARSAKHGQAFRLGSLKSCRVFKCLLIALCSAWKRRQLSLALSQTVTT